MRPGGWRRRFHQRLGGCFRGILLIVRALDDSGWGGAAWAPRTAVGSRGRWRTCSELRLALHQLLDGQSDFVLATKDGAELLLGEVLEIAGCRLWPAAGCT
jgi:hypothetical protein